MSESTWMAIFGWRHLTNELSQLRVAVIAARRAKRCRMPKPARRSLVKSAVRIYKRELALYLSLS